MEFNVNADAIMGACRTLVCEWIRSGQPSCCLDVVDKTGKRHTLSADAMLAMAMCVGMSVPLKTEPSVLDTMVMFRFRVDTPDLSPHQL